MAKRLRPHHQDDIRAKIKVSNVIDRLEKHVAGTIELSTTQVASARILLDKTIASLSATEHSGSGENGAFVLELPWLKEAATKRGWV